MSLTAIQLEQQKRQAEELLFSGPETMGFVKGLFFGHFNAAELFPYPQLSPAAQAKADQSVTEVRQFCREKIDAAAIDRLAARFTIRRDLAGILAAGRVEATVTQACSVPGDPLPASIDHAVGMPLRSRPASRQADA